MNSLTLQNMNGVSRHLGFSPASVQTPGVRIPPTYAPWWKEIPGPKGTPIRTRRNLEPGQLWRSDEDRRAWPVTPNNDARDLPNSFTGKPLRQLPHREFTVDFPHTWIDYEKMYVATGPEMGQEIPGWEPIPWLSAEKQRAIRAAMPSPWSAPENMAYDVSGLGDMPGYGLPGGQSYYGEPNLGALGLTLGLTPTSGVEKIATEEATKAATSGASTSTVQSIIDNVLAFGTTAYSLYEQKRLNDKLQDEAEKARRAAELAAQARSSGMPQTVVQQDFGGAPTPWYKNPVVLGVGIVVIGGLAFVALT